ncbi:NUDIX hydrolase [Pyxidicoccus fallax]|uniref:GDP-mannose pyrophosphatase n=1 Tax=Pyxidicoccus fallax TaxID=394095 RepID=A0A848LFC6_9BACT|nr:NUDIX hydrolase [Pyxidicoccus fallax]NMO15703.1 NUDIX hydrolase [Pyxidicoccus fallax]NPC77110.1 NUDIX hydrolase [Pyxidicoccus fallax]
MTRKPDITTLDSREVYSNRWMRVREDRVLRADGSSGIYGVVEKPDFVVVVPVEGDCVHLVEQFRYPSQARFWEFPQGAWEQAPDTAPAEVARAELREETGLEAAELVHAGSLLLAPGYSTQSYHVFLARGLIRGEAQLEREEQDLVTARFKLAEVEERVRDGRIRDATTVAALGLLRLRGLL